LNAVGNWMFEVFGLGDGAGSQYLFWSGAGSDITELAIVGALLGALRKHNCETHRCWRMGRHDWTDPTTGQTHKLCRKCHPLGHLTAPGIKQAWVGGVSDE
jgi:hypothetical protein